VYEANAGLRRVLDAIAGGQFSAGEGGLFHPLVNSLLSSDDYMLLADYQSYVDCQDLVNEAFLDEERWTRMSILNVARMGKFSSDRAIREYCEEIWDAKPVPISLGE
jgi:starch phosphorylase